MGIAHGTPQAINKIERLSMGPTKHFYREETPLWKCLAVDKRRGNLHHYLI